MRNIRKIAGENVRLITTHNLFGINTINVKNIILYENESEIVIKVGRWKTFCRKDDKDFFLKYGENEIHMGDGLMKIDIYNK